METACQPRFRRLALGLAGAVVALVPTLGVVANADASMYVLPDPPLKNRAVDEGRTAAFPIKLTCPFPECAFRISTAPGTAKADGKKAGNKDYNPFAYQTIALTKGQRKTVKFKVLALTDDVCEKDEYFYVKLEGEWSGVNDRYGGPPPLEKTAKVTIKANANCLLTGKDQINKGPVLVPQPKPAPQPAPQPEPQPLPAPTPPPAPAPNPNNTNGDSTGGKQTNWTAGSTTIARCTTDLVEGVPGVGGAWGHYIDGCTVKLTCPTAVRVCQASEESRINTEFYIDHKVTMNSRMRVFSAGNVEFWKRDQSCANTNWCAVEDMVMIRGGESASVQCNGVRQSGPEANRAKDTCSLTLESQY